MNISMTFIRIKERKVGTTMNVLTMFIQRKEKKKQQQTSWWRSFKEEKKGRNNNKHLDDIHLKKKGKEGTTMNILMTFIWRRKERKERQWTSWWCSFGEEKKGRNNKEHLDNIHSKKKRKKGITANVSSKWQTLEEEDLQRKNHSKEITSEEERMNDNVNRLKKRMIRTNEQ